MSETLSWFDACLEEMESTFAKPNPPKDAALLPHLIQTAKR